MKRVKLDKNGLAPCNGRPQLYHSLRRGGEVDRLRIIYPNGTVEYSRWSRASAFNFDVFIKGCTSRAAQQEALEAAKEYSDVCGEDFVFLGYL